MVLGWRRKKTNKEKNNNLRIKPVTTTAATATGLEIPAHFLCPISLDLMRDPVTVSSGITYDRGAIDTWLDSGGFTCPVTNQVLRGFDRVPNHALLRMIQDWSAARGLDRVPTPRVLVHPAEASEALRALEASAARLDSASCAQLIATLQGWGAEGERSRVCVKVNGAVNSLAKAFDFFASAHYNNNSNNNNDYIGICDMILSALSWMIPFRENYSSATTYTREYANTLGSEPSMICMVEILSRRGGCENAAAVLEELTSEDEAAVELLAGIEGAGAALIGLVRARASPRAANSALAVVRSLVSCRAAARAELVGAGLVSLVLDLLVESDKGSTSERALGVMDGLCGDEEGRVLALENSLTMPVLVKKLLRVSALATEFSVSAIWKLLLCGDDKNDNNKNGDGDRRREVVVSDAIVEALQVGAFQKLLVIIQVGCGDETKEKVTELLKLLNTYRPDLECIESVDFKSLKRSF